MMLKIMKEPKTWSQARQSPSGAATDRGRFRTTAAVVSCLAVGVEDGSWLSFFLVANCIVEDSIDDG